MSRKFWVLLAFGGLSYEAEHRRLDLEALKLEAETAGGALGGMGEAERLIAHAEERRGLLSEHLPYGAPDDWVAVGSRPLFDEYERKVREIGRRFDPTLDENDARLLRRQMEAICVAAASVPARSDSRLHPRSGRRPDRVRCTPGRCRRLGERR